LRSERDENGEALPWPGPLRRRPVGAPGPGKASAHNVARERDPLLNENPRDEVAGASERLGTGGLQAVAAPLKDEGDRHGGHREEEQPRADERRESRAARSGHEQRHGDRVHCKVSPVSVTVRIDTELPCQEAAFSGLVHAADLGGTVGTRRIGSSRPREGVLETHRTPAVGHGIRPAQ